MRSVRPRTGPGGAHRSSRRRRLLLGLLAAVISLGSAAGGAMANASGAPLPHLAPAAPAAAAPTGASATVAPTSASTLNLAISSVPSAICVDAATNCSAGAGEARVQMTAIAYGSPTATWPNVQVAFVLETTAYDGVYFHGFTTPGLDPCARAGTGEGPLCEESNGVPFFMAHAGQVAGSIQAANPHANVTFALVDYFATGQGDWSDGTTDGSQYHVDVGRFATAADFGPDVTSSLVDGVFGGQMYGDIGLDDNFLHSPSIIALYGAIIGSGLDWSPNAHHVIVLITSTAPQDPMYKVNYRVSPSFYQPDPQFERHPYGATCSPSFPFPEGASPNCEGWIRSPDGNAHDNIAALAHEAAPCVNSVGKVCTVDVIDLWTTPTDPYSPGWPTGIAGGGPGGPVVVTDSSHILQAGCDLAAATDGSWDGPGFWSCSNGEGGDLTYVPHGPVLAPITENPSLLRALSRIAFGPIYNTITANHTNASMFQFVPFGSISLAPDPQWATACSEPGGVFLPTCDTAPSIRVVGGVATYGWNWSTNATANVMSLGDQWTVSFYVVATGPPYYAPVPIDACATYDCRAKGSIPVGGFFTWAQYIPSGQDVPIIVSFPITQVEVVPPPPPPHAVGAPPVPPPPPPLPTLPPAGTSPVLGGPPTPIGTTSIGSLSVQAVAAGLLGAGFTRVTVKNRPIAQGVASLSGVQPPRRPGGPKPRRGDRPGRVGRFV